MWDSGIARAIALFSGDKRTACTVCGEGYHDIKMPLCRECYASLAAASLAKCRRCGKSVCDCTCNGVRAYSLWWYDRYTVRRLIHRLKHGTDMTQVRFLAELSAYAIKQYRIDRRIDAVAAVPSRPAAIRKKGYGHAEMLGSEIARVLGLPYIDALYRTDNREQKLLSAAQRRRDLKLRFGIKQDRCLSDNGTPYSRVLLVDDIITSGGTIGCCSALLRKGGVKQVTRWTLAKAMKKQALH